MKCYWPLNIMASVWPMDIKAERKGERVGVLWGVSRRVRQCHPASRVSQPQVANERHKRGFSNLSDMQIEYLLNTGNLVSNNTLDLSQNTGFTVVAEKLNFFRWASASLSSHGQ